MKKLKNIMQEYHVEQVLVPTIVRLLKKDKLTNDEEQVLDLAIEKFLNMRY